MTFDEIQESGRKLNLDEFDRLLGELMLTRFAPALAELLRSSKQRYSDEQGEDRKLVGQPAAREHLAGSVFALSEIEKTLKIATEEAQVTKPKPRTRRKRKGIDIDEIRQEEIVVDDPNQSV